MPQEGCASDMQEHELEAVNGNSGLVLYSEVQNSAPEVAHMLHICLAEAAEIMLAHKVGGCLLHGFDVQLTMLHDKVLVAPLQCIEPGDQPLSSLEVADLPLRDGTTCLSSKAMLHDKLLVAPLQCIGSEAQNHHSRWMIPDRIMPRIAGPAHQCRQELLNLAHKRQLES